MRIIDTAKYVRDFENEKLPKTEPFVAAFDSEQRLTKTHVTIARRDDEFRLVTWGWNGERKMEIAIELGGGSDGTFKHPNPESILKRVMALAVQIANEANEFERSGLDISTSPGPFEIEDINAPIKSLT